MNSEDRKLAEAAASLTVQDFRYLQEHRMICPEEAASPESSSQQGASSKKAMAGDSGQLDGPILHSSSSRISKNMGLRIASSGTLSFSSPRLTSEHVVPAGTF